MMTINKSIFRAYDIRGSSISDINADLCYKIGFCFANMTIKNDGNNKICVGMDGRISSPTLYYNLIQGLLAAGAHIISIGVVPTPILYFADKIFNPSSSIMITGSHNQKNDNGFKMLANGKPFFSDQIQSLLNKILNTNWTEEFKINSLSNHPNIEEINVVNKYIDYILNGFNIEKKLKVAWDPSNGAAGHIIDILKKRLDNNNIVINSKVDGNFPNHPPDPTILANLKQLIEIVTSEKCDIGIGLDGDADRIAIVTKSGRMILGDQILCLFAKDIISYNPNATIIMDVKTSQVVFDQIKSYGGKALIWKTGHSFIKDKMLETNAILAGETSGHIFFADKYYGYDDGIYAAIRFLDLLSRSNKSLDEMIDELPQTYNSPEIKINVSNDIKFKIIEQIKQQLTEQNIDFNNIDGIRANTKYGWWLLRASNTEAKLTAKCESPTQEGLITLKSNLSQLIKKYGLSIN